MIAQPGASDEGALVYLGLGSNVGDKAANLREAVRRLQRHGTVEAASGLYRTEPVGFTAQDWFLNAAIALRTRLAPGDLLQAALRVEHEMGRIRTVKNGPRSIDIDLLVWGATVVEEPGLSLPHPRLHERLFVLAPLAEIAPRLLHPRLGESMECLRDRLRGEGGVEWFGPFGLPAETA